MSANVHSIAVIAEFRAALCTFIVDARLAIAALEMESRRAVDFITHDQAEYWKVEARRGAEAVNEGKQNLSNARTFKSMDGYTPSCDEEKKAVEKAQRRLQTAQLKSEAVKHWGRMSEQAFREFTTRLSQFVSILDGDLPKAVAALERMAASLDRYLATAAPTVARLDAGDASGQGNSNSYTNSTSESKDSLRNHETGEAERSDKVDAVDVDIHAAEREPS